MTCALDLSGRPYFVWQVPLPKAKLGDVRHRAGEVFFEGFARGARLQPARAPASRATSCTTSSRSASRPSRARCARRRARPALIGGAVDQRHARLRWSWPEMELIPAIDLLGGKVVRLHRGDYAAVTVYSDDPPAQARRFYEAGARRLHVVDLDGARDGQARQPRDDRRDPEGSAAARSGRRRHPRRSRCGALARSRRRARRARHRGGQAARAVQQLCARHPGSVIAALDARGGQVAVEGWLEHERSSVRRAGASGRWRGARARSCIRSSSATARVKPRRRGDPGVAGRGQSHGDRLGRHRQSRAHRGAGARRRTRGRVRPGAL